MHLYITKKALRSLVNISVSCCSPFSADIWGNKLFLYKHLVNSSEERKIDFTQLINNLPVKNPFSVLYSIRELASVQGVKVIDQKLIWKYFSDPATHWIDLFVKNLTDFMEKKEKASFKLPSFMIAHTLLPCVILNKRKPFYDLVYNNRKNAFLIRGVYLPSGMAKKDDKVFVHFATIVEILNKNQDLYLLEIWREILDFQKRNESFSEAAWFLAELNYREFLGINLSKKTLRRFQELKSSHREVF